MDEKRQTIDGQLPSLLNALQVAQALNIAKSTAYLLIQQQEIPSVRIGRAVRVRPADLERYIDMNLVGRYAQ